MLYSLPWKASLMARLIPAVKFWGCPFWNLKDLIKHFKVATDILDSVNKPNTYSVSMKKKNQTRLTNRNEQWFGGTCGEVFHDISTGSCKWAAGASTLLWACAVYQGADRKRFAPFLRVSIILGQYLKQTVKGICSHWMQLIPAGGFYLMLLPQAGERDTYIPQLQSNKINTHMGIWILLK